MTNDILGLTIAEAEQTLAVAGVWNPREDAEVLAAHVLDIDRNALSSQMILNEDQRDIFFRLVAKRASRIPIAYIIGHATFGGIEVKVGPGVFVPRMHTEPMLAWGLDELPVVEKPLVVDLCTGSGAIALAVAHARPDAIIHAIDSDQNAMNYARYNAEKCAAAGDTPIQLHLGDVTSHSIFDEFKGMVDLILANPPFVSEGTKLLPEWGEHHPYQSIYSGNDGSRVIRSVVYHAAQLLRSGGGVAIEHDDSQGELVTELLQEYQVFTNIKTGLDHHESPRFTTARKR
ncbi:peptide chain release factor N(5)-glutamine methyltransferase [Bacillus cereus group sp. BfR-BA-01383]|uniref:peptide chain release factor N(5)-glutamine methyltransferase n=1 Tax=Bacillus cereus group sp. BfR-BA-01383 TaxID=2920327 RepID=UPI001F59AC75|nr:peptide chain release factor N(5)-glutamine methyltransferase [Bacillus cereus group sp. BfR-BA-01383]